MKHTSLFSMIPILVFLLPNAPAVNAAGFDAELHHRIVNTKEAQNPYFSQETIMFSYQGAPETRVVSLAFEHESYGKFHTYTRNEHGIFILTLPVPEDRRELAYRLIVDGLWTTDPKSRVVRDQRGILISTLRLPSRSSGLEAGVSRTPDGKIRFVYKGADGAKVFVVGDFNSWDPYLTPMPESEIHPGVYETTLAIGSNANFYRFVVNGKEIIDPANQLRARNGWGEDVSRIQ